MRLWQRLGVLCADVGFDVKPKLSRGTSWVDMVGSEFGYAMVFEREAPDGSNALTQAEFGGDILG